MTRFTEPRRKVATESSAASRWLSLGLGLLLLGTASAAQPPEVPRYLAAVLIPDGLAAQGAELLDLPAPALLVLAYADDPFAPEARRRLGDAVSTGEVERIVLVMPSAPDELPAHGLSRVGRFADQLLALLPPTQDLTVLPALVRAERLVYGASRRSDPFAVAVARALPAVVQIAGLGGKSARGAGFVYDPAGLVLTAAHLVPADGRVMVTFAQGEALPGESVGRDPSSDLAVIRLPATRSALQLAAAPAKVGESVVTIGHPFDRFPFSASRGIIAGMERELTLGERRFAGLMQTDAPLYRGNSGGPLLNQRGEVIGICIAVYSPAPNATGVGFAVPIDEALLRAAQLISTGAVAEPGWRLERWSAELASALRLDDTPGLVVVELTESGPAASAGVRLGDRLLAVSGAPVDQVAPAARELLRYPAGEPVPVTLSRGGVSLELELKQRPPLDDPRAIR